MCKHSKRQSQKQYKIKGVESTDEKITGRGGLSLFVKYLENIQIMQMLLIPMFACLRKSKKGAPVEEIFKQIICKFLDGTCRHLSYFDKLQKDEAYSALIETSHENMVSSHTVKRFLKAFSWPLILSFRPKVSGFDAMSCLESQEWRALRRICFLHFLGAIAHHLEGAPNLSFDTIKA